MNVLAIPALAFFSSWLFCTGARRIALLTGFMDSPGSEPHKGHGTSVPLGGGPAVLLAVAAGTAAAVLFFPNLLGQPHSNPVSDADWTRLAWLGTGTAFMALLGLLDDIRPLPPKRKLLLQGAISAAVVLLGDVRLSLFIPFPPVGIVLSILWLILVTNIMNLLDNHDGVAGGVAAVASVFLALLCLGNGEEAAGMVLLALAGALGGFLVLNFPPARIYMGDAGSLPVGFLLGGLSIIPAFYHSGGRNVVPLAVLAPVFIFAVPLFDTIRVFALRAAERRPLLKADRNHFSHRLEELTYTPREIAGIHYLLALLTGSSAVLLPRVGWQGAAVLSAQLVGTLVLVLIMERGPSEPRNT